MPTLQHLVLRIDGAEARQPLTDEHAQRGQQISICPTASAPIAPSCSRPPLPGPSPARRARDKGERDGGGVEKVVSSPKVSGGSPFGAGDLGSRDIEDEEALSVGMSKMVGAGMIDGGQPGAGRA